MVDPGAVIGPGAEIGAGTVIARQCGDRSAGAHRPRLLDRPEQLHHPRPDRRPRDHPCRRADRPGRLRLRHGPARATSRCRRSAASSSRTTSRSAPTRCIDRGANRDTVIGEGTKIDNLVQIGHNVVDRPPLRHRRAGRHLRQHDAGGFRGARRPGRRRRPCHASAWERRSPGRSSDRRDVPRGARWGGYPARPIRQWFREMTILATLPSEGAGRRTGSSDAGTERDRAACVAGDQDDEAWTMTETAPTTLESVDIMRILELLPHRYPVPAGRPDHRDRRRRKLHRHQERHLQRAAVQRPLSRPPGDARRVADRGHGADGRRDLRHAKLGQQAAEARLLHDHRQGEVPQARRARRPGRVPHAQAQPARQHVVVSAARRRSTGKVVAEAEVSAMLVTE